MKKLRASHNQIEHQGLPHDMLPQPQDSVLSLAPGSTLTCLHIYQHLWGIIHLCDVRASSKSNGSPGQAVMSTDPTKFPLTLTLLFTLLSVKQRDTGNRAVNSLTAKGTIEN